MTGAGVRPVDILPVGRVAPGSFENAVNIYVTLYF
jgi:hypothetical protein